MTQIFYLFTFKSSHTDLTDFTDFLPFYPLKVTQIAQMTQIFYFLKVPQAVPSRKTWRGL